MMTDHSEYITSMTSETASTTASSTGQFNNGTHMTSETASTTASSTGQFNNGTNPPIDYNKLLQQENSFEAALMVPVTIYLVFLMIIGVVGNILVLYVYKFRFKRSTSRVFILSLALFDMLTCVLGLPYHILDLTYPLTFVWNEACKTMSFSLMFTILSSIFVLDLIAIDRYRKICIPFKKQLSPKGTKIICWVMVMVSAVFSLPIIFIYGSAQVETRIPNVTGTECYISNDFMDSDIPMIFDSFNILIFLVSVFILSGLYIKVGIVLWKRRKFHDSTRNSSKRSISGTSTPDTSVVLMHTITDDVKLGNSTSVSFNKGNKEHPIVKMSNSNPVLSKSPSLNNSSYNSPKLTKKTRNLQRKRLKRLMSEISSLSGDESSVEGGSGKSKFTAKKQMRTMRITAMLFIITLIFVISFLPYLIISIMNGLDENFWNDMSIRELVIFNLLLRTYFINNMVNPIVYWFLDKKFKQEVRRLFKDIRKCDWSKTFRLSHQSFTS